MIEQGTPEWFAQRLGKATASRISDIIARTKSGYSTSRANYAAELVCERLTGNPTETFKSAAMQWGTEKEPEAKAAYEFIHDVDILPAEFITHPKIPMAGASPDGYVGDVGLVEVKCPFSATHIDTLLRGQVPDKYEVQMLWQMACTGRSWCDYISFDPRLPPHLQMFVKRIHRNDARIQELEDEVVSFLKEVQTTVDKLAQLERAA